METWTARRMACQTARHVYNSEVIDEDGEMVAGTLTPDDAALIAAAPDMLEALKACRVHIETLERMHDHELPEGEMLRESIRKATTTRQSKEGNRQ